MILYVPLVVPAVNGSIILIKIEIIYILHHLLSYKKGILYNISYMIRLINHYYTFLKL